MSQSKGKKRNPGLKIPKEAFEQPQTSSTPPRDLDSKACISIGNQNFEVKADDLEPIVELGRGAYGVVEKMRHVPSEQIMAVKVAFAFPRRFLVLVHMFVPPSYKWAPFIEARL